MKRILKLIGPLLLALILGGPAWAQPAVPHAAKPPFPQLTLPDRASGGQRAIDLLGARLPEVAAWYGKSADEFKRHAAEGPHAAPGPARPPVRRRGTRPAAAGHAGPGREHRARWMARWRRWSRPSCCTAARAPQRTIYLNFKGATLSGTAWNGSSGSITALPFDLDGMPYSYSSAELQRIQYIWQRVAEDYAAFDVDVTTEAVPLDRITRSGSADDVFGTTVLITNRSGVYSCSCGGVAYVGIFDDTSDYYKPALVFYDALGSGNEKYVAEAISHEAGHNMGLAHDGYAGGGYYQGPGQRRHRLGADHGRRLLPVAGAVEQGRVRHRQQCAGRLCRDAVQRPAAARRRPWQQRGGTATRARRRRHQWRHALSAAGRDRAADRHRRLRLRRPAPAAATFNVAPAARSANLDALMTLRDAAGTLLASANPTDALNASFSVTLPAAGTYYLSVQGTGKGDPLTTGYTNYGSIGQYARQRQRSGHCRPGARRSDHGVRAARHGAAERQLLGAGSSDPDGSIVGVRLELRRRHRRQRPPTCRTCTAAPAATRSSCASPTTAA